MLGTVIFCHLLGYLGRLESHLNIMWKKLQTEAAFSPKSQSRDSLWRPFSFGRAACGTLEALGPLLVPIRSYWLLLALYFARKKSALPVHSLRQVTGSAGTAMDVLVTRALLTKGGEFERREPKMGGARHLRRRPFEHYSKLLFFRVFFNEMSLKHSACHTFRASRVPCNAPKSPIGLNLCTPSSQTLLPFC